MGFLIVECNFLLIKKNIKRKLLQLSYPDPAGLVAGLETPPFFWSVVQTNRIAGSPWPGPFFAGSHIEGKHALQFQNGGRLERRQAMSVRFNFKHHGQIWLPDDDSSTGTQINNVIIVLSSVFRILIALFMNRRPPSRCLCRTKTSQLKR